MDNLPDLTLSQDQEAPEGDLILTPDNAPPLLDQGTVDTKATKFHLGLGPQSPGKDVIASSLLRDNGDTLRTAVAAQDYATDQAMRRKLMFDYAQSRPSGELQPGESEFLNSLTTSELQQPVDILEKKWAQFSINATLASDKKDDVATVEKTVPSLLDDMHAKATERASINEQLQTASEQLGKIAGFGDYAMSMVPAWGNYQTARTGSETLPDSNAYSTGNVLRQQAVSFHLLPYKDQVQLIRKLVQDAIDGKENAVAARAKIDAFIRYGVADQRMNNAFFYADGLEFVPGGIYFGAGKFAVRQGAKILTKSVARASIKEIAKEGTEGLLKAEVKEPYKPVQFGADYDPKTNKGYTTGGREFSIKETPIVSSRTGDNISARMVRTEDGKHVVEIDPSRIKSDFENKVWTKPRVEGVEPLPEDAFASEDEWRDFLVHHEVAHIDSPRLPNESLAEYENHVNQIALIKMGKRFGREIVDPETGERVIRVVADTPANRVQGMMDAAVENAGRKEVDPVGILETNGDVEDAVIERVVRDSGEPSPYYPNGRYMDAAEEIGDDMAKQMPGFVDPNWYLRGAHNMSEAATKNFLRTLANTTDSFLRALYEGVRASRVTREQLEAASQLIRDEMRRTFHGPSDAIIDSRFRVVHESNTQEGINYAEMALGREDGTLFKSPEAANDAAVNLYHLTEGSYSVPLQQGNGYYIVVRQAVDETMPGFRDLLIDAANKTPTRKWFTFSRWYRSANAFNSEALNQERLTATLNATGVRKHVQEATAPLGELSSKQMRRLEQILEHNRDFEAADGTRGFWFKTVGQFETHYKNVFGSYPTEAETTAYFTYRSVMDYDYLVRNGLWRMEKSRLGLREITLSVPAEGEKGKFLQAMHNPIEGHFVDEVMPGDAERRILIIDSDNMETKYIRKNVDGLGAVKEYQEKGYKLVQLANPNARPLMKATGNDNYIQYVLTKDFSQQAPKVRQIPYSEGGHVIVEGNYFLKQPRFVTTSDGSRLHLGDRVVAAFSNEKEVALWEARFEKARKLYLSGDDVALRAFIHDNNLPYQSLEDFKAQFTARTTGDDPEPIFDATTPFVSVADRQGVNDVAKVRDDLKGLFDGVEDTIEDPTNTYRLINKKFGGEKSTMAYTIGQDENALWNFQPARHMAPMRAMQDAVSNAMRSSVLENVQIKTVENWIQQFGKALDVPPEQLRRDPMEHLLNPKWNRYADPNLVATAKGARIHALNFLGLKSAEAEQVGWVKNKLVSSIYGWKGKQAADVVDEHMLPYVKDYSTYIRAVAFHTKLGLFAPAQLFLQANTLFHTMLITGNPLRSASSVAATQLMMMGQMTKHPSVMQGLAKAARALGWKKDEFLEMWRIAREQSLDIIGGEHGDLSNNFQPKVIKTAAGKALDMGTVFFRTSERMINLNAWATAYKEFRALNPTKMISAEDIKGMMRRQDILTNNMRNASNAAWQHGIASIPSQFSGYVARMSEQIYGRQLTLAEKARLVGGYSLLYGIPGTAGIFTLYPVGHSIRQYLLENGMDTDANVVTKTLTDGLISMAIENMTGTKFNVGERIGPGSGIDALRDLVRGDKTFFEIATGPSGGVSYDLLMNSMPLLKKMATFDMASITEGDVYDAFKGVSSVSNATKLIYAHRTHKHLSTNGTNLGPMNDMEAWIMFTTGLSPQRESDMYLMQDSIKDLNRADEELGKLFKMYLQRADKATDEKTRDIELKRAYSYVIDIDPTKIKKWEAEVIVDAPMLDKTREAFVKAGGAKAEDRAKLIYKDENQ